MPNISSALQDTVPESHLHVARRVGTTCADLGVAAFLVGGSVRDSLMGVPCGDLDIAVEFPQADFVSSIAEALGGQVVMSSQFSTARIWVSGVEFDIVMARSENYLEPGALPTVAPGPITDDLARRDFSINAMAVELSPTCWGELIDPYGGQADLKRRVIRTLHCQSFKDDATRLLRAARYASRFGFELAESTLKYAKSSTKYITAISPDRYRNELEQVFNETNVWAAISMLNDWGCLDYYLPGLELEAWPWLRFESFEFENASHRVLVAFGLLALAASLPSLSESLNLDAAATRTVRDAMSLRQDLSNKNLEKLRPSQLVEFLDCFNSEAVNVLVIALAELDTRTRLNQYLDVFRYVRPSLDGKDLLELGVPKGPLVGRVLDALRDARLDGDVSSTDQETALARNFLTHNDGGRD